MSKEENKALVTRYNKVAIEACDMELLKDLMAPDFINHSGVPDMPEKLEGMTYFFTKILHASFSYIQVEIKDMVAEENKVVTRKEITGTHTGTLMGIPATGRVVTIKVIDILTIENGKISGHWGENNFSMVVQRLSSP